MVLHRNGGRASAPTGTDMICHYSTKQEAGYFCRVSGLLLYRIISLSIKDRLVILLGAKGYIVATDFFSNLPTFGASRLNT